jgi:hypothetical protein
MASSAFHVPGEAITVTNREAKRLALTHDYKYNIAPICPYFVMSG